MLCGAASKPSHKLFVWDRWTDQVHVVADYEPHAFSLGFKGHTGIHSVGGPPPSPPSPGMVFPSAHCKHSTPLLHMQ